MMVDLETEKDRQDYLIAFGQEFNCDVNGAVDNIIIGILGLQESYVDDGTNSGYAVHQHDYTVIISESDKALYQVKSGVILESNTEFYQVVDVNPDKTGMIELTVEKQLDRH